jgi:NAD+ synthase
MITRAKEIAEWIRQQVTLADASGVVIALTRGLESAVVARLCEMATPGRVVCPILLCGGDAVEEANAEALARELQLTAIRLDLAPAHDGLLRDLDGLLLRLREEHAVGPGAGSDAAPALVPSLNLAPRLQMTALYYVAESLNCLVAGTGNRAELTAGSFAKYGETAVDLLPLGNLLASEVRALARELEIPETIIEGAFDRPATRQLDEQHMGFSYAELERYLANGPDGVSPALAMRIERLLRTSEHRRALALKPGD